MPHQTPLLVLFDIDGTLIQSGKAGLRGMNLAFERLYGRERAMDGVTFAGRTDKAIVIDALRGAGIEPTDDEIRRVRDAYFDGLRAEIGRPVADPCGVLPGVESLLGALEGRPDVIVALLTGNFHGGAAIKLGHFGLWDRFPFGSFGDDEVDRRALVPVAVRLAREAGHATPAPARIVIIGDTPLDVDCAKAYGARCVGVATGPFSCATLADAGADVVVETLEGVGDLVARFA